MHAPRPQTCTTLPRDQAVVWLSSIHRAAQPDDWPSSARLLDEEEQRRYRAYRFPADARLYLHAHVLLRTTLSRYANVPPEDWRFVFGGHGRPEIATFRRAHLKSSLRCSDYTTLSR